MRIQKKDEKAQSEIIGTVLLILITIVVAGIIMAFIIPYIKEKLPAEGESCLDIITKVKIKTEYTCYNSSSNFTQVQIHIDDIRDSIKGFTVELGGPSSKSVKILEDEHSLVEMYGGGEFELPNNTEERTYILNQKTQKPDYIAVYSVLNNKKVCEASGTLTEVEICSDEI
ncbi:MAG: archaellin/type IV pilin N-terminal domain-containing protein [Candidatus Pacearchaeota archaeon]|jgi:flagellin-like protein